MNSAEPIRISVDLSNPGQFFACCGLFELANRMWPKAEVVGVFYSTHFEIRTELRDSSLERIIDEFVDSNVQQLDLDDDAAHRFFFASRSIFAWIGGKSSQGPIRR